jgi:biotin synthase
LPNVFPEPKEYAVNETSCVELADTICGGYRVDRAMALSLHETPDQKLLRLLAGADMIRRHFKGKKVTLCSIVNAKSGRCPEDCAFCSQSAHHTSDIPVFPLLPEEELVGHFKAASAYPIDRFGVVVSGKGLEVGGETEAVCRTIRRIRENTDGITACASLGVLSEEVASLVKEAGLQSYHHNVETSRGFFPRICGTHRFEERVSTVRTAKQVGFQVCCGGIFGLGESPEDRVDMAMLLRELDVDSVPLNFLVPIPGTKLADKTPLQPMEILKIIALFRYMLPEKDIRVCGGRETNLRDLQALVFFAGANGFMLGNYLTTKGRSPEDDLQLLSDLGLEPVRS